MIPKLNITIPLSDLVKVKSGAKRANAIRLGWGVSLPLPCCIFRLTVFQESNYNNNEATVAALLADFFKSFYFILFLFPSSPFLYLKR